MKENDIDLRSFDENKKDEDRRMLEASFDEYAPIQKNARLFKFILYTTKVEIKANSLIKMIYSTTLFELALWFVGFLLFIASPSTMWLIWILIIHVAKGVLGFFLLNAMPKTYEIIENIAKNPHFEEDKIIDLIQTQIRETFMNRWLENKKKLFFYLLATIIAILIDISIFIVQIVIFGKEEWILMQTCLLFIILVFLVSDVVYFLWFITLKFSFPDEMLQPIKKAILGSMGDLKQLIYSKFRKPKDDSAIN